MTSDEYWHGDPLLPVAFRAAHTLRQDDDNQRMWWQGYYNYTAVATALQNGFREKGKKAQPYPKEPFKIREEKKTEPETEQDIIAYRQSVVDMLNRMKADYDREQQREKANGS